MIVDQQCTATCKSSISRQSNPMENSIEFFLNTHIEWSLSRQDLVITIIIIITTTITTIYVLITTTTTCRETHCFYTTISYQRGATSYLDHWPTAAGGHPITTKWRSESGGGKTPSIQWKDGGSRSICQCGLFVSKYHKWPLTDL